MPSGISTTFYCDTVTPCSQHSSAARHRKRFLHTAHTQRPLQILLPPGTQGTSLTADSSSESLLVLWRRQDRGPQNGAGHAAGRASGLSRGTPRPPRPAPPAAAPIRARPPAALRSRTTASRTPPWPRPRLSLPAPPALTAQRSEGRPPRARAPSARLTSPLWQLELAALPPAAGAAGRAPGPPQRTMGHRVHKPRARYKKGGVRDFNSREALR